jgi:vesicle transport through interaction with t-SNAREs protein 1
MADMEFEIAKSGPNSRLAMNTRLKQYKLDVEIMQRDLKKASTEVNSKAKSFESGVSSSSNLDPERKKILQIQNSLKNAGDSVARSTQIAIETENIGTSVLGELNSQGERLRNANARVIDFFQSYCFSIILNNY